MTTLRDELNKTISSENIKGVSFARAHHWNWVLSKLANTFLAHGENTLNYIWLWEWIKEPYVSYQPENSIEELQSLLNELDSYWLIASDEAGKYWVLQGTGTAIITLISETRYFEYYITNENISWLICENHHNVMVLKSLHRQHKQDK